ncbi:MAG: AMP-binding protein, partial [Betaproteobacteria bacterium]|nr:AMP-binding protein [Betaproteobacteria bacterium]
MDAAAIIRKNIAGLRVKPNLVDYEGERRTFDWNSVGSSVAQGARASINLAELAVDRHAAGPLAQRNAYRFLARGAAPRDFSYAELARLSNRFCNVLRGLGVGKGERVFVLAGRIPELYLAVLGTLKNGCVVSPLFSAFGPEPIATRVNLGTGKVLVTTDMLYERKVEKWREKMPSLEHVLLVAEEGGTTNVPGTLDLATLMAAADDACAVTPTGPEDMSLLHFTSGTTGTPKGAVHVHGAVATHWATGRYALDLHDDDIFWCTADPGWVTGTSYGIIAPLLHGVSSIVDREEFDAERWYGILQDEKVTVWYTAPTAIRMLMKAGAEIPKKYRFPRLRFIASVGEPLNPEAVRWGQEVLGLPIHDNWWQTETGGIMIANYRSMDIRPGSMGKPMPGVRAAIVRRTDHG